MDLVYPLGKGSLWRDLELKYSLRSVEKHLLGFDTIYVIGEKPLFASEQIKHIPFPDKHANAARNIMEKFAHACTIPELSDDFLYMNDDYFFTAAVPVEFYGNKMPYKGTLEDAIQKNPGNDYQRHLIATFKALTALNLPTLNYDGHCPIVMNKAKLSEIIQKYSWNIPYGYTLRSIYCNDAPHPSKTFQLDVKINHPYTSAQWAHIYKNLPECFSIGDHAITFGLKNFLQATYPTKSRFEI